MCVHKMIRKTLILIVCLSAFAQQLAAQKPDFVWPLGTGAGIDFNSGVGEPYEDDHLFLYITNTSISDANGELLFYSNGVQVVNAQHEVFSNGSGLSPGTFTDIFDAGMPIPQGALIIPDPGNWQRYYLFHLNLSLEIPGSFLPDKLFYSVIDMSLDNGLGNITSEKNIEIIQDSLVNGRLTAVRHGNGRDWWVLFHREALNS